MNPLDGQTVSNWMAEAEAVRYPPLEDSLHADVCVVGAGIAGISTAYHLALEGQAVVVLDAGIIGVSGETPRTTAHLSDAIDDRYTELERLYGLEHMRMAAESHTAAINRIAQTVNAEGIDCDFARLDGYLFLAPGDHPKVLEDERDAARRAGLINVHLVHHNKLGEHPLGPSLCFPEQAQLNIRPYMQRLIEVIQARGGRVFAETRVTKISGGKPARIETERQATITANHVVIATNSPFNDRVVMHTKIAAYRSYVIALPVPLGSIRPALYWDTGDPYHYVRLAHGALGERNEDLLIVGGEDHKTGQAEDGPQRWARLEKWTRERIALAGPVRYRWSGQIMETIDALGFIGRNPLDADNVYIVTGDSGHGVTHATIAAMLLTDLISGRANPWEKLYDPARKTLSAVGQFAREGLNVMAQYADYLTIESLENGCELGCGQGGIVRHGLAPVAAYRDENGMLHEHSAICPHLGCVVSWNSAEHTWDCPCHGSRFSATGAIICGPAVQPLAMLTSEGVSQGIT